MAIVEKSSLVVLNRVFNETKSECFTGLDWKTTFSLLFGKLV